MDLVVTLLLVPHTLLLYENLVSCCFIYLIQWLDVLQPFYSTEFAYLFLNTPKQVFLFLGDLYSYKFLQRSRGVYSLRSPVLNRRYTNSVQIALLLARFILLLTEIIFCIRSRTFQPLRYIQPYRRILQSHRLSASRQSVYCHIKCYITYSNYGTAM